MKNGVKYIQAAAYYGAGKVYTRPSIYYRGSLVSMVFGDTLFSKVILKFYVFGTIHTLTFNLIWSYYCLFSDLCVFKNVFGSNVYHSGILELSPNEYSWRLWLPYCNFAETNRSYGNTASFLYYVHDTIYIVVSW